VRDDRAVTVPAVAVVTDEALERVGAALVAYCEAPESPALGEELERALASVRVALRRELAALESGRLPQAARPSLAAGRGLTPGRRRADRVVASSPETEGSWTERS
jgi:hypothetical protein